MITLIRKLAYTRWALVCHVKVIARGWSSYSKFNKMALERKSILRTLGYAIYKHRGNRNVNGTNQRESNLKRKLTFGLFTNLILWKRRLGMAGRSSELSLSRRLPDLFLLLLLPLVSSDRSRPLTVMSISSLFVSDCERGDEMVDLFSFLILPKTLAGVDGVGGGKVGGGEGWTVTVATDEVFFCLPSSTIPDLSSTSSGGVELFGGFRGNRSSMNNPGMKSKGKLKELIFLWTCLYP